MVVVNMNDLGSQLYEDCELVDFIIKGCVVFFLIFGFLFCYLLGFSLCWGYEVSECVQSSEMGIFVFIMQFILCFFVVVV